ncbi:hypothetical protein GQ457_17G005780 [Hibiscus cannabinus]
MAHSGDENVEVVETQRETRAAKAKRATSRDRLSTLEDKVERLEDGVRDAGERLDVVDGRLSELETKGDEFKDDVNIAFNKVVLDYFGYESDAKSSYNVELMFAASFDSKMGCLYSVFDVKKQGKPVWVVRARNWKLRGGENRLSGLLEGVSIASVGKARRQGGSNITFVQV